MATKWSAFMQQSRIFIGNLKASLLKSAWRCTTGECKGWYVLFQFFLGFKASFDLVWLHRNLMQFATCWFTLRLFLLLYQSPACHLRASWDRTKCLFDAIKCHRITAGFLTFASSKRLRLKSALLLVFPAFALSPEPPSTPTAAQGEAEGRGETWVAFLYRDFPGKTLIFGCLSGADFRELMDPTFGCPGSVPKFCQSLWQEILGRNLTAKLKRLHPPSGNAAPKEFFNHDWLRCKNYTTPRGKNIGKGFTEGFPERYPALRGKNRLKQILWAKDQGFDLRLNDMASDDLLSESSEAPREGIEQEFQAACVNSGEGVLKKADTFQIHTRI